jgi:hypothetical protein
MSMVRIRPSTQQRLDGIAKRNRWTRAEALDVVVEHYLEHVSTSPPQRGKSPAAATETAAGGVKPGKA